MGNFAVKQIDDMEAIYRGAYKRARAELGVGAFGLSVLDLPPSNTQYPEHDHGSDGQEEVYVPMGGSGEIEIEGERFPLEPGTMVRVGPGVTRKLLPGDEGMRVLAIGGVPGQAYEPGELSQLGVPDPTAQAS